MDDRPKILIADDQESLRLLARETLEGGEADLLEAADGIEALRLARTEIPRLILLDVAMPGLTGFEVLEELKNDPLTENIIVVMLTAHGQTSDRDRATMLGADHFMTKPFSPVQLLRLVDELL